MNRNKLFLAIALFFFLAVSTAWGQASVPNTFSAGTAASASEVNANFQALVDAIDGNSNSIASIQGTSASGYSSVSPFPPSSADPENVVILRETNPDGTFGYSVRIAYIEVDGTATWDFPFVTSANGATADFWDLTRWELASITNSRERTVTNFVGVSGSPPAAISLVDSIKSETEFCFNSSKHSVPRNCIERSEQIQVGHPKIGKVDYRISSITRMLGSSADRAVGQSVTINGITFSDIAYRFDVRAPYSNRVRIMAKGIGLIYQKVDGTGEFVDTQEIIYYRVNGSSGGSLTGTPFDSGGQAVGVFFSP